MSVISTILGSVGLDKIIDSVGNTVDKFVTTDKEREALKQEIAKTVQDYHLDLARQAYADTASARDMYTKDNWLQKIYALVFLVGYMVLTVAMLWFIYELAHGQNKLPEWAIAFVSTVFGAMSTKVSTITDFLFGSSQGSRDKDKNSINQNTTQNG